MATSVLGVTNGSSGGFSGYHAGSYGTATNTGLSGQTFNQANVNSSGSVFIAVVDTGAPQNLFSSVTITNNGAPVTLEVANVSSFNGGVWEWDGTALTSFDFTGGSHYTWTFTYTPPAGNGDITDPDAWEDANGNIPPAAYNNVPEDTNYPLNGDGRYWFNVDAETSMAPIINFIGNPDYYIDTASLQWSITQVANDGSDLWLSYSINGTSYTDVYLGPNAQNNGLLNGQILVDLAGATGFYVQAFTTGGTASTSATPWQLAVSITRNANEAISWDSPNPFDPINYNGDYGDTGVVPTATLAQLRARIITRLNFKTLLNEVPGMQLSALQTYLMQRLGFSSQAASPPPGMANLLTAIINEAQQVLYRRYAQDGYADAAPALLVNPTDALTLDNMAVQMLAVATAKAQYGQQDAQIMGQQFNTYLKELLQRSPPTLTAIVNDALLSSQTWLYKQYTSLHTRRLFRWKVQPGQRFYSLLDNDENVLAGYNLDPTKTIEWAGIQDTRNVWYPLIEGIPPQLYTMIDKPWRPARYTIRNAIELYPAPDQTYWLWLRGHFGLLAFSADDDKTTIDSELVYLHALALCKKHYNQPDADVVEQQSETYRMRLIAGTHATAHYVPGTIAVPPAVRPTLIQYQGGESGSS